MGDSCLRYPIRWCKGCWVPGVLPLLAEFLAAVRNFAWAGSLLTRVHGENIFSHFFNIILHAVLVGKVSVFRVIVILMASMLEMKTKLLI
jgi:hypothetical protein